MILALTIALLIGSAVYLIQQRGLVRIVLGMMAFGHGANMMLLATGVYSYRGESFPSQVPHDQMADPLPQALILTAIVIGFATTALLLTVALRAYQVAGHDDVEAFGYNLARTVENDLERTDPEHQSPDVPDWEDDTIAGWRTL